MTEYSKKRKRNIFRSSSLILLLLLFLNTLLGAYPSYFRNNEEKERLNLLLITIDTLRADRVSCYSHEHLKTPLFDSLAEKGVLFSRAFAHAPITLTSHASILLGTTPLRHGVHDNANFVVKKDFLTLAEYLKNYGYSTAAFIGGYPLDSRFGLDQGFDLYDDEYGDQSPQKRAYKERKAEVVVRRALDWLKSQKSPWFLWVHCYDPHNPYEPPEPYKTLYKNQVYDGEVAYVDSELEKLINYLKENKLFEKTMVFFTADHGESLGQHGEETHGYLAYNTTLWVPLIICIPGLKPGRVEQQTAHIDIFPTVCDVLKIEKPSFLQGISLLPAIHGKRLPARAIYFECLYPYYSRGWAPLYGYIQGNEKFVDSPLPELYDLEKDFDEHKNLISGKTINKYKEKLSQLTKGQSPLESFKDERRLDRESLQKLRSLGYISSPQVSKKEKYGPEDDVKALLPYHNKSIEAANLYERGKKKEAIEYLEKILAERKDIDIAYSTLADLYKEEGRTNDALEVLRRGIEVLPSSYEILSRQINFLLEARRFDNVIQIINASSLPQIENDPDAWNELGIAYMSKGDFKKAEDVFEKAISLDDGYSFSYQNLGSLYFSIFLKNKEISSYQKSLDYYKKAIELEPGDASAYNGLGAVYLQGGNLEGAIYCLGKALELKPDYGLAVYNLGLAYFNAGKLDKAYEYFVRFKEKYSRLLSPAQMRELESLIEKCNIRR